MEYQILMAVTVSSELVKQKIKDFPDLSRLTIVNNFIDEDVAKVCSKAESEGATVLNFPKNLGCGASCNIGLRKVLNKECDLVFIVAPSANFLKDFKYCLELVEEKEAEKDNPIGRYQFSNLAKNHFFALNFAGVSVGGLYDEHFWPAYLEDNDWNWRSKHNGMVGKVGHFNRSDLVSSHGTGLSTSNPLIMRLHQLNNHRKGLYYEAKWGSQPPRFIHPFNNENLNINHWEPYSPVNEVW